VQEYSPEIDQRLRSHLRPTNDSWRVDETYTLVKGKQKYLYRAVDSAGNTLDFLLIAKRDALAAKRFFHKMLKAIHPSTSRVITVDKNLAYLKAIKEFFAAKKLSEIVKLLNNIVEQNHRGIKRLVKPGMGFGSFNTARRTIRGYEIMNMVRKRQVVGVPRGAIKERLVFIHQTRGVTA
jgi:transposase, IS6 family